MRIQFEDLLREYQSQMNYAIEEVIQKKTPIAKLAEGFIHFAVNIKFATYLNSIAKGGMPLIEKLTDEEIRAHQRGTADALYTILRQRLDEVVDEILADEELRSANLDSENSKGKS